MNNIKLTLLFIFLSSCFFSACRSRTSADNIIDRSIEAHGGTLYEKAHVSFDFRKIHYTMHKNANQFEYSREFYADSLGQVKDVLNNRGFTRQINGEVVNVTAEREKAFSNSVNSVAYFAYVPYGLNDKAVRKTQLPDSNLNGNTYHLIHVTFLEEGGGEDFEDEFLYWIDQESFQIKFMAYSYITDGGGVRFRKAVKEHWVDGILFLDYENYMPTDPKTKLDEMQALYEEGALEMLSEIRLENIQVHFED
ncbi:DUF6503 family protein [Pararhodonellum marinum]|uniref:DUF6503 family protein n=1 Tax=Pararhodonellum marinum TaxID=2755358 RepID=UPI001E5C70D0|nr:DUF6503 family protein [Pararhodonellum marinum]